MKLKAPSSAACTLTLGLLLLVATTIFANQLSPTSDDDKKTTQSVIRLIKQHHISQRDIDDNISGKLLDRFIKVLDPLKLYFHKADIAKMQENRKNLDDLVKAGNVDFAFETYTLFQQRATERIGYAHQLIEQDFDFTKNETIVSDPDALDYVDAKALNERWRKRIKYDRLDLKLQDTDPKTARERLHKRYRNVLRGVEETENGEKLETYLSALAHCFDPHSSYMSPDTLEEFRIAMRLSLDGIGAALRSEDGHTTVAQIVAGGAAHTDKRLKVGDKIIGVAQGEDGEMVDIVEMKLSKVVKKIRGKRGTTVRLKVLDTNGAVQEYILVRKKIDLSQSSAVKGEIIETKERLDGRPGRIGVINIPSFYRDFVAAAQGDPNFKSTSRDVKKVLKDFRTKGVDMVVVDLRMNGGGALQEAIEVSGLFIEDGPVVQVKEKDGSIKPHIDTDGGEIKWRGPLVVVCNRLSASASEIFAGVIQDYQRGLVVGDKTTHGKGTVQNVMQVSNNRFLQIFNSGAKTGALKLTINQFYRVNGDSTQERGVRSDVVLPSLFDYYELGEEFLDNRMHFDQIRAARHDSYDKMTPAMGAQLRQASKKRVDNDKDFAKVVKAIAKYIERKNRTTVSLNHDVLKHERNKDKIDKKKSEKDVETPAVTDGNQPIFPENFYNDELLEISLDYLALLKGAKTVQRQ